MPLEDGFGVIILAAGAGSRLGRDKATLPWGASTLIRHVIEQFPPACTARRVVVLSLRNHKAARENLPRDVEIVVNPDPKSEMLASVRLGVELLGEISGPICIHPVDVFAVISELVMMLHEAWRAEPKRIHLPRVGNKGGHPLIVPPFLVSEIGRIPSGCGLNSLIREHKQSVIRHEWHDERLVADIDTMNDYFRYRP